MIGKQEAMQNIMETSFVLVELTEYLDTHPACSSGLAQYHQAKDAYEAAVSAYTAEYGALNANGSAPGSVWQWVTAAWPWELED